MTPGDWKELAAAIAFVGGAVKACTWVADRFDATARRSIDTAVDGLKMALAETATDLRQGIDGVKEEISELRTDLHAVSDRTVNHEARLNVLEQFDTVTPKVAAKKTAKRKAP
jgi:hypothetical protein